MSYCDWQNQTGYLPPAGTTIYPDGPDYSLNAYGYGGSSSSNPWPHLATATPSVAEQRVYTKNNPTTCKTWNGHSAPGGFYSIEDDDCSSSVVLDGWVHGTTGNSAPCASMKDAEGNSLLGTVIHIPVFDCLQKGPSGH